VLSSALDPARAIEAAASGLQMAKKISDSDYTAEDRPDVEGEHPGAFRRIVHVGGADGALPTIILTAYASRQAPSSPGPHGTTRYPALPDVAHDAGATVRAAGLEGRCQSLKAATSTR
jgi:hypothetical protein